MHPLQEKLEEIEKTFKKYPETYNTVEFKVYYVLEKLKNFMEVQYSIMDMSEKTPMMYDPWFVWIRVDRKGNIVELSRALH